MEEYNIENNKGQSLIEVIIAILIGALLIITSSTAIVLIVRNNLLAKNNQTAGFLAQELIDNVQVISESDWNKVYNLSPKGSSNPYFILASSTQPILVAGEEGILGEDITNGLVGYWKFDEATTTAVTYDYSDYNNVGTLTNGPIREAAVNCKASRCLSFDGGNDFVDCGNDSSLNVTGEVTLAAWVKWSQKTGSGYSTIVEKYEVYPQYNYSLDIADYLNQVRFFVTDENFSVVNVMEENVWTHLTATFDGSYLRIYKNGKEVGNEFTTVGYIGGNNNNVYIGKTGYFNGDIDEVRIYNRALLPAEIKQLYKSRIYTRKFTVENVNRDDCGTGDISSAATSTCTLSGVEVLEDPSTQKITAVVNWVGDHSINIAQYLTRHRDSVFAQTNWSGGAVSDEVITFPNNRFSTSTDIDFATTTGSIVLNLGSASGTLISSIFDTRRTGGAAFNAILWQGDSGDGTVKFQIASSDNSSGPWNYYGWDGSNDTYYPSSGSVNPDTPISIMPEHHNNDRYVRYKVFLTQTSNSPRIDDIIINWSP